ncbi:hypothetical protein METBIDRAFT_41159 [Metschnikowia bicuspidata var. bicuspidata NRRL YB-4993]|uniref:SPX domain-containing protein n=1 Tax=Metschnikowia bicuspidata var. bicuspidata NRRL YB-4993 TaxID=869754 RepID=A0A1A0HBP1_9ASCO|nr:hypothetical protein METBIDRAFT_41159 [Metschnikowia bicuspidata var. bicuspidata NRRL YB-4993]OBA21554.1 hypothetical protein METBIDRAFT_41159 [Metschnikowia bicuspidata var. bicuspidata NRRL YB-4993]
MKFGKNLAHLSIPEWKDYNLDYNDLKKHIRDATQTPCPDLRDLRRLFLEKLGHVDLFVMTKLGELARKVASDAAEYARLKASTEPVVSRLQALDMLHYRCINEVSSELRKLNKFVLVQKLAVKKILKKFAKHYPDHAAGKQFVASLNKLLHTRRASFTHYDALETTATLVYLLLDVEHESRLLHESLQRRPARTSKVHSSSSIGTLRTSVFSGAALPEDVALDVDFDLDISLPARFDLITALKKNFALHGLVPRDVASRNDICLSMDVYLNIPKVSDTFRLSVVYLSAGPEDDSPSCIISYEDSPVSTVIACTGGLRKYSYCCLPNTVVNSVLAYTSPQTGGPQKQHEAARIASYLLDDSLSHMTKVAVTCLLESGVSPCLCLVMARTRYFLHRGGRQQAPSSACGDKLSISPISGDLLPASPSLEGTRLYEDSFYLTLDEHIYTSCHVPTEVSFDVASKDPFPFSTLSVHSNDSNLHNFEASLSTEIQGNVLQNKYRAITLKRLPLKIQNLLKTPSVQLFKDLNMFDYMRSCYCNVIPPKPNNHYSRLLCVNLFKCYENMEALNDQHNVDGSIIQDKSRIILNRQKSYKSLREVGETCREPVQQSEGLPLLEEHSSNPCCASTTHHKGSFSEYHLSRLSDLEQYNDEGNEDSYIAYLNLSNDLEDNFLNNAVLSFIRFKYRMRKLLGSRPSDITAALVFRPRATDHWETQKYNYDSINEDTTFLDKSNDYQDRLVHDYDYVLSLFYFSLCFSSIFISGINIGILYSLFNIMSKGAKFSVSDNFMVFILLTFGFLFSLAFTMMSINLNFQRFKHSPSSHSGIIWTGFILVVLTTTWSLICIIS